MFIVLFSRPSLPGQEIMMTVQACVLPSLGPASGIHILALLCVRVN